MPISEIKNIIGIIAVALVFAAYVPYLRDIIKGKTKPHIYSWFVWGFTAAITFSLQMSDKAGAGAFITLAAAIMCLAVLFFGIMRKGSSDIKPADTVCLFLALVSLGIWFFAKQPIISIILITTTDALGFVPTIRKSYHKPFSETLSFYGINSFRFALAIIALQRYTIITALYPSVWFLVNSLFIIMLVLRRRCVGRI